LGAVGVDAAAVDLRAARRVRGHARQRRGTADRTAEGGRAGGVDRQPEGAIDPGGEGDVAAARGGQRAVGAQGDGVVVGRRPAGGDRAAVERRAAGGVGGQAGQGGAAADGAAEGRRAAGVDRQGKGAIHDGGEADVAAARRGQRVIGAEGNRVVV